jgi:hypothetical protein
MRTESEWVAYQARVLAAVRRAAEGSEPEMVDPRQEITIATAERAAVGAKRDVDSRVPAVVDLTTSAAIFGYRPIDFASLIGPRGLMVIAVEGDTTTPDDHAYALYERAKGPKQLVIQTETSHYAAYGQYRDVVSRLIVDWFSRFLLDDDRRLAADKDASIRVIRPAATIA